MYNVYVPNGFLWSIDGSLERRRWPPRAQAAAVVDEESFRLELASLDDERFMAKMRWVVVIEAKGGFSLRAEWNPLE